MVKTWRYQTFQDGRPKQSEMFLSFVDSKSSIEFLDMNAYLKVFSSAVMSMVFETDREVSVGYGRENCSSYVTTNFVMFTL